MKDVELKLVSELMKNSRRSDRDLAKTIGVSQPTVSRLFKKLEKEGVVKEYTMIPDFRKLGFSLLAITFSRIHETENMIRVIENMKESLPEAVMFERGLGLVYDGVIVSFHEDYSSYVGFRKRMKDCCSEFSGTEGFLISLDAEAQYYPLTFATFAQHLLILGKKTKEKP
jgi:DNA-binding Lrp family transcriptional regulator